MDELVSVFSRTDTYVLDDPSASFVCCLAALAFGVFGFSGTYEVIRLTALKDQETRYLNSIARLSVFIVLFSLLPIALPRTLATIASLSFAVGLVGSVLFLHSVWELLFGKVRLQNKTISFIMFPLTFAAISASLFNAVYLSSFELFKLVLLWATFALLVRFFLFIRHVARIEPR